MKTLIIIAGNEELSRGVLPMQVSLSDQVEVVTYSPNNVVPTIRGTAQNQIIVTRLAMDEILATEELEAGTLSSFIRAARNSLATSQGELVIMGLHTFAKGSQETTGCGCTAIGAAAAVIPVVL